MQHGNMERHTVTRRDPGMETCLFSSLLVVSSGLVIRPCRCGLNSSGLFLFHCVVHSSRLDLEPSQTLFMDVLSRALSRRPPCTRCSCSSPARDAPRTFGIVPLSVLQPPP
jgi:hypothetical protein